MAPKQEILDEEVKVEAEEEFKMVQEEEEEQVDMSRYDILDVKKKSGTFKNSLSKRLSNFFGEYPTERNAEGFISECHYLLDESPAVFSAECTVFKH